jgi:hypothetical protein
MDRERRRILAVETVNSIFNDIDEAMKRASALFGFEMSFEETLKMFLDKKAKSIVSTMKAITIKSNYEPVTGETYTGERRNLHKLFLVNDWIELIRHIGNRDFLVRPDDYFYMPVHISAITVDGVEYDSVDIDRAKVVVTHVFKDKVVFNFDDVLLYGAMNSKNTNEGGFEKTALCGYLNGHFIKVFSGVDDCLAKNNYDNKISLPTSFEVFGNGPEECNWTSAAIRLDFFKNIKNRIRCKDNNTEWSWLSSPYATNTTSFCIVHGSGSAGNVTAGNTCGVAPCFCISNSRPFTGRKTEEEKRA